VLVSSSWRNSYAKSVRWPARYRIEISKAKNSGVAGVQELQNATAASGRWAQAKAPAFVVLDEEAKAGAFSYVGGEFRCLSLFSLPSKPAKRAKGRPKIDAKKCAQERSVPSRI
jgi:hypothetical protein